MLQPDARDVNSASGHRERQVRPTSPTASPAALANIPIFCYPVLDLPPRTRRMAKLRRKPSRAETARANGARSRGPATPEGKARSRLNGLAHGLRARSLAPVAALGETPELVAAHVAAYRREFPVPSPCARDLAAARPRAARADRLEAELLAGLSEGGRSTGRSFHDDPDTRAALALVQRYRREAELAASRARRELEAL